MTPISTFGPVQPQPIGGGLGVAGPGSQHHGLDPAGLALAQQFGQILNQLMQMVQHAQHAGAHAGSNASPSGPGTPAGPLPAMTQPGNPSQPGVPQGGSAPPAPGTPAEPSQGGSPQTAGAPAAPDTAAMSSTSAGNGPNDMKITNNEDHAITVGEFKNGESTTDPSAKITLQPHQTGDLKYQNGDGGFDAQADASGKFQPDASRLEFKADADGKNKYVDTSHIDGRNASIGITDGAGLNKGDTKSIAGSAPASIVTTDSGGNKTIAGSYDGSTEKMRAGADFLQRQLGTAGSYIHPDDDKLPKDQNPMTSTTSSTVSAAFGAA